MESKTSSTQLFGQMFVTLTQSILRSLDIEDSELTPLQMMIVMGFYTHPNVTMSELAQVLNISSAQLSRTIRHLEDKGLVRREHNKDNRRVVNVHRTKDGDKFAEAQIASVKEKMSARLSNLTPQAITEVERHLAAIVDILAQAGVVQMSPEEFIATLPTTSKHQATSKEDE